MAHFLTPSPGGAGDRYDPETASVFGWNVGNLSFKPLRCFLIGKHLEQFNKGETFPMARRVQVFMGACQVFVIGFFSRVPEGFAVFRVKLWTDACSKRRLCCESRIACRSPSVETLCGLLRYHRQCRSAGDSFLGISLSFCFDATRESRRRGRSWAGLGAPGQ